MMLEMASGQVIAHDLERGLFKPLPGQSVIGAL